jgi:serine protease DegQ
MKKAPLYSRSRRYGPVKATPAGAVVARHVAAGKAGHVAAGDGQHAALADTTGAGATVAKPRPWLRTFYRRHERLLLVAFGALAAALLLFGNAMITGAPRAITQEDIDAAVRHSLETKPLPSRASQAYEVIRPSVVKVQATPKSTAAPPEGAARSAPEDKPGTPPKKLPVNGGSGVVILDNGTILTNLHVVAGAERIGLVFFDGQESDAVLVSAQPENDLAVLRAKTLPDDLVPATLTSTADLRPGDEVIAVGFPFGIGPSVSAGVVSGLKREYRSPEGERILSNLIQFDAAANPGNSGGPLVTADGSVVGIVSGILNPTEQRVFIGIGFAVPIENAASAVGLPPF